LRERNAPGRIVLALHALHHAQTEEQSLGRRATARRRLSFDAADQRRKRKATV